MKRNRGYTLIELLIALVGLLVVVGGCAAIYVFIHFLIKFW